MKMIIDTNKKICFLLNPKTGTSTLFKLLENQKFYKYEHTHTNYDQLLKLDYIIENINDIDQYKFIAFYRDPVDRFLSAYAQMLYSLLFFYNSSKDNFRKVINFDKQLNNFLSFLFEDESYLNIELDKLSYEICQKILNTPIIKIIEGLYKEEEIQKTSCSPHSIIIPAFAAKQTQKGFLYNPNTLRLNFHDFENSMKIILDMYKIQSEIYKENSCSSVLNFAPKPSEDDIKAIKEYCKEDYEFFDSVGITF